MISKHGTPNMASLGKTYSDGAVDFIKKNAGKMSAKSIASILKRTEKSVKRKAEKMGISLK